MNEKNIKNYLYVCPYCFNVVKECECFAYPPTLIQIDKNMLPIIRELNKKMFLTEMCCEGHIGLNEFMYIEFKKNYKFKTPLPKGFVGGGNYIRAKITGSSEQAKKRKKRALLNDLYRWACEIDARGSNMFIK